ncbi:MAG TPA: pyrroline-5-carboxylate reductase [Lentisphaeria bacterium]|nr:MAG: pyrroline-5-carboxylate reductase [Lentisphaerae bacterium GWF2_50_93]HCE46109.1 pyrroline-5-carboxylate reductase [Lentisphaeria bacterium]
MKLAIIGSGKMATALALGIIREKVLSKNNIVASDIIEDARKAFENKTGIKCVASSSEALRDADVVLLAVKPQSTKELIPEISKSCQGKLIISIMAGIPLRSLYRWFGSKRAVRTMPNTPLMVSKGATAIACGDDVSASDRELTKSFFKASGIVYELPESSIDLVTALSGSGPAFAFEYVQAMVDAAEKLGMDKEVALELTVQTVSGAAEMLKQKMGTPDELRNAVTSKGGTTAAGLAVLEKANFRKIVHEVIQAAENRSKELGKLSD